MVGQSQKGWTTRAMTQSLQGVNSAWVSSFKDNVKENKLNKNKNLIGAL